MRIPLLIALGVMVALPATLHAQQAQGQQDKKPDKKHSVELAASDKTLQLYYRSDTNFGRQPDSEVAYGLFLSEHRDFVGSAALLFGTELNFGFSPLEVKLGPQAYAAFLRDENNDVFSIAIGAQLRYVLVRERELAITGNAFYAPDILTFGSANRTTDFMVRAEIKLSSRVLGFGGYRWFNMDLVNQPTDKLQNQVFAGINWQLR